jgi:hypothetical protein
VCLSVEHVPLSDTRMTLTRMIRFNDFHFLKFLLVSMSHWSCWFYRSTLKNIFIHQNIGKHAHLTNNMTTSFTSLHDDSISTCINCLFCTFNTPDLIQIQETGQMPDRMKITSICNNNIQLVASLLNSSNWPTSQQPSNCALDGNLIWNKVHH